MRDFVELELRRGRGNPYWYEIEHCHNFTKTRLEALLQELGFENLHYDINQRYRTGMEVVARKRAG